MTDQRQYHHSLQVFAKIPGMMIAFCNKKEHDVGGQSSNDMKEYLQRCFILTVSFNAHPSNMVYCHGDDGDYFQRIAVETKTCCGWTCCLCHFCVLFVKRQAPIPPQGWQVLPG